MDVRVESSHKKEIAHEYIEDFLAKVKEKKDKAVDFVKDEMIPYLKIMAENVKDCFGDHVILEEVDVLDKDLLVSIAKKYMVENANQVAAYKKRREDDTVIYLTYCRDRESLPKDENRIVIIKAEAVNKETKEIFKDSDLVLLI